MSKGKRVCPIHDRLRLKEEVDQLERLNTIFEQMGEEIVPFNPSMADGFLTEKKLIESGYTADVLADAVHYEEFYPYVNEVNKGTGSVSPTLVHKDAMIGVTGCYKRVVYLGAELPAAGENPYIDPAYKKALEQVHKPAEPKAGAWEECDGCFCVGCEGGNDAETGEDLCACQTCNITGQRKRKKCEDRSYRREVYRNRDTALCPHGDNWDDCPDCRH